MTLFGLMAVQSARQHRYIYVKPFLLCFLSFSLLSRNLKGISYEDLGHLVGGRCSWCLDSGDVWLSTGWVEFRPRRQGATTVKQRWWLELGATSGSGDLKWRLSESGSGVAPASRLERWGE